MYYGTAHVSRLVPIGSYIDMRDFESHTALAEYMVRLMENETLYDSYLNGRNVLLIQTSSEGTSHSGTIGFNAECVDMFG